MRARVQHPHARQSPRHLAATNCSSLEKHQTIVLLPNLKVCPGQYWSACCAANQSDSSHDVHAVPTGRQALASPARAAHVLSGVPVSPSSGSGGAL